MSIEATIRLLTRNEIRVLYWTCRDLQYKQIALRLGKSVGWVQGHMTKVYEKFGVDKKIHSTDRRDFLENSVCPVIREIIGNDTYKLDEWPLRGYETRAAIEKPLEETIDAELVPMSGTIEDEEPRDVDPKVLALVVADQKQTGEDTQPRKAISSPEPKRITIPPQGPSTSFAVRLLRYLIFAIVGFCFVSVVVYYAYTLGRGSNPPLSAPTDSVPTQSLPTPSPFVPTEVSTDTPLPSATPVTITPSATLTPTVTATSFVPPADGILFQDNFENGISPEWTQVTGEWIVSNGRLNVLTNNTGNYNWIALNKPEWKNYILSVNINIPFQGSAAQSYMAVAIRTNSNNPNYLGVRIPVFSTIFWAFIGADHFDDRAVSGENRGSRFTSGSTLEIEVRDNNFAFRVDGQQIQSITLSGYEFGGIRLGTECDNTLGCPSFDDVKVTYLP